MPHRRAATPLSPQTPTLLHSDAAQPDLNPWPVLTQHLFQPISTPMMNQTVLSPNT